MVLYKCKVFSKYIRKFLWVLYIEGKAQGNEFLLQ